MVKPKKRLFRAQSGSGTATRPGPDGEDMGVDVEVPLPEGHMIPDPKLIKNGGRANPPGFAYLYLATDPETALAEMRPWLREHLTLALFEVQREIKLVVCRPGNEDIFERLFEENPSVEKVTQYVWNDIGRAFARPVSKDDQQSAYIPTQILAEVFKAQGFDGLAYRSSLARGTNVVLFDVKAAKLTRRYLYCLKKARYGFEAAPDFAIYRTKDGKSELALELHTDTPD